MSWWSDKFNSLWVKPNYTEADTSAKGFIQNKPTLPVVGAATPIDVALLTSLKMRTVTINGTSFIAITKD